MDTQELHEQVIEKLGEDAELDLRTNLKTPEGTQILVTWTRPGSPGRRAAFAHNLGEALRKVLHYEEQVDEAIEPPAFDCPPRASSDMR